MNEIATIQPPASVIPSPKPSALNVMAMRYNVEPTKLLDTLKQTVFKNATDAQLMALVVVANEYGLNPFTRQLYAFPDKGGGIVPVIGVDGWMKLMNSHPDFDGVEIDMIEDSATGKPYSCTATIHVKNRKIPTKVTEHLSECFRNTDPWNKQPRRMLRHRAIIQAARVAFGFSAMDPDEADAVITAATAATSKPDFGPATVTSEQPAPKQIDAPQQEAPRRGRPPKVSLPAVTEVQATTQPATAPAATPAPEPPKAPAASGVNYVKGLRGLCALESLTEEELLAFGRSEKGWEDSLGSLEEVQEIQPSKLEEAYNQWSTFAKAIKSAKAAEAKAS